MIEKRIQNMNDVKKLAFVVKNFKRIKVPMFPNASAREMHILFV